MTSYYVIRSSLLFSDAHLSYVVVSALLRVAGFVALPRESDKTRKAHNHRSRSDPLPTPHTARPLRPGANCRRDHRWSVCPIRPRPLQESTLQKHNRTTRGRSAVFHI